MESKDVETPSPWTGLLESYANGGLRAVEARASGRLGLRVFNSRESVFEVWGSEAASTVTNDETAAPFPMAQNPNPPSTTPGSFVHVLYGESQYDAVLAIGNQ